MGISIAASGLKSRQIRRSVSGNGLRKIDLTQSIAKTQPGPNLFERILNGALALKGFITSVKSEVSFSFSEGSSWLLERIEEAKEFDWNATDAELQQSIQQYNVQIAAAWSAPVGRGIGTLGAIAVGAGIGILVPVIGGAALAKIIGKEILKEALPELLVELGQALTQTILLKARQAAISAYINIRHFIKQQPKEVLIKLPGIDAKFADRIKNLWGAEGAPVLSFNKLVDDKVETIKSPVTQAFVEGVLEDSWNSFVEGTFIIAPAVIDDIFAARELDASEDKLRAVKILPDKTNPDEEILFYGREKSLIGQISGTLNTHQMIHGRDIGFFEDGKISRGLAAPQKRTLRIIFYSSPAPPWRRAGQAFKKSEHKIPDPKAGLTWQDVKRATGGSAGIKVGDVAATVNFANGRSLIVYGDTKDSAIANARRLADLSESDVVRVHTSENFVSRQSSRQPVTVYGAFIHVGKVIPDASSDRQNLDGQRYREEKTRHALWPDDAPENLRTLFS